MRIIGVLAWLALVSASSAATLSNPRRVSTNFEFSITGASNAIYAIQASSDLTNWTTVATNRQFGEVRTISMPASAPEEFYRVRSVQPLFTGAFGVRESIEFAGSGVTVVSFDSHDPRYFQPDGTRDRTRFSDRGDIITSSVLTNSLDLGNSKVFGVVRAPRDGLVVLGPGGSVGSIVWHLNGGRGIEPGWYAEETNRVFVDAELPQGHVYVTPGPGSVDGTNYTYVLTNGHYALPELRMANSNRVMLVTGRATLYVSDFFALSPPAKIVIVRDASLDVYVGAESTTLGLSSVEDNNLRAAFTYYGLPGNTQVYVHGDGFGTGTIYAPAAAVIIGGGGNDEADISGAIVGRSIRVSGKLNMHYDEALRVAGPAL